ncbi:hypothetical protein ACHAXS_005922 [Conticribra weissflogii]
MWRGEAKILESSSEDKKKVMRNDEKWLFEVLGIDAKGAQGIVGAKMEWNMNGYDFMLPTSSGPLHLDPANENPPTNQSIGNDFSPESSSKNHWRWMHSIHDNLKLCASDLKHLLEGCKPHDTNLKLLMELDHFVLSSVNIAEKMCLANANLKENKDQNEFAIPENLLPVETEDDDWISGFQQSWCDWSSKHCEFRSSEEADGEISMLQINKSVASNNVPLSNAAETTLPSTTDHISFTPIVSVESCNNSRIDPRTQSIGVITPGTPSKYSDELKTNIKNSSFSPASRGSPNACVLNITVERKSDGLGAPSHLSSRLSSNPRLSTDPASHVLQFSPLSGSEMSNKPVETGITDSGSSKSFDDENESERPETNEYDTLYNTQEEKEKMARMMEEARENVALARERKRIKKRSKVGRWIQEQEHMKRTRAESWSGRISKEKDVMEIIQRIVVTELVRQNSLNVLGLNEARVLNDKNFLKEITSECRNAMQALFADLGESQIVVRGCCEKELNGRSGMIRHWEGTKKLFFVCLYTKKSGKSEMRYIGPENLERVDSPRNDRLSNHVYEINLPSFLTYGGVGIGVCFSLRRAEVIAVGSNVSLKAGLKDFRMQREKEDRIRQERTIDNSTLTKIGEHENAVPQIQERKSKRKKVKKRKSRRIVVQEPRGILQAEIARKEIKKFIEDVFGA